MKPAPVSACLIVRNEEKQIEKCLLSLRNYVEEICVVDTGSSDKTPEIVKGIADKFESYSLCNDDYNEIADFSKARQKSMSLASKKWMLWVDGDDELVGGENIPKLIDTLDSYDGPQTVLFPYEYAHDDHGNPVVVHTRERIVTPVESFFWQYPVHEVLLPKPNVAPRWTKTADIKLVHRRTGKVTKADRNLRIMKKVYEQQGESDARILFYLATEYDSGGFKEEAAALFKRYVRLSGWDDEICHAMIRLTAIYQHYATTERDAKNEDASNRNMNEALDWALRAHAVKPKWFEPYYELCRLYYKKAEWSQNAVDWDRCCTYGQLALKTDPTETLLFVNPMDRKFNIHGYLNVAFNKCGRVDEAYSSAESALAIIDHPAMRGNRNIFLEFLEKKKIRTSLHKIVETGRMNQEISNEISQLLDKPFQVPTPPAEQSKPLKQVKALRTLDPKGMYDIAIWTGMAVQPWGPNILKENWSGGSEIACVNLANLLVKKGHKVRVFSDCVGKEGTYDGVEFIHYEPVKEIDCDVFISSRQPWVVEERQINAVQKYLWVHDVHAGIPNPQHCQWMLQYDRHFVLSDWHKEFYLQTYPYLNPECVIKTANGIDLSRFKAKVKKSNKLVYSSSLDRGLELLLKLFPSVKYAVPDAELHVYYGFDWWEKFTELNNNQNDRLRITTLKEALKQDGVHFHGSQPQSVIAEAYLGAKVWAYPTWFTETFGITALEAQAGGAIPVTTALAGLKDTVGSGVRLEPPNSTPEYQQAWIDATIKCLKDDKYFQAESKKAQAFAKTWTWGKVADQWESLFREGVYPIQKWFNRS